MTQSSWWKVTWYLGLLLTVADIHATVATYFPFLSDFLFNTQEVSHDLYIVLLALLHLDYSCPSTYFQWVNSSKHRNYLSLLISLFHSARCMNRSDVLSIPASSTPPFIHSFIHSFNQSINHSLSYPKFHYTPYSIVNYGPALETCQIYRLADVTAFQRCHVDAEANKED